MKAIVDRDACIGCGLCESICPAVFEIDEESIALVLLNPVPADAEDCTRQAEDDCPVEAISIEE